MFVKKMKKSKNKPDKICKKVKIITIFALYNVMIYKIILMFI